jgi:DNA invertase Pin-like site-specific DNA recombinase/peptidoglycan hydrolase-like protein with peptidoglycan-binding domain
MQTTYRVQAARLGAVALVGVALLLALPGTASAASAAAGAAPIVAAGEAPLARGAGYARPHEERRVRSLQRTLRRLGWAPGPLDGLYGPLTEAAVVRFQRAAGLAVDGVAGPHTARALWRAARRPLRRGEGYGQPQGSPRVRSLQARLRALGLRPGPLDGRFGPRTEAALARLQAAAGAAPRGVVDAATRRLLANAERIPRGEPRRAGGGAATAAGPAPGPGRERASRPAARGATGLEIAPLLIAGLAALAGAAALLVRLGAAAPATFVPIAHGVVAEGRSGAGSIGGFRGRVHAVVLGTRGPLRRPEARYLVNDPGKPGPFWVGHGEVDRLVGQVAAGERAAASANGAPAREPRALGYATVPRSERSDGALLREQAAAIEAHCERRGWRLLELVRDVEEARVKGLERPGLGYALERLARGEAACLVVAQLRRLSPSAAELGRILESIAAGGGRLVALDVELDTAQAAGRKAANVLIAVGQRERERVGERTRKGLAAARARGRRIARPAVGDVPELKQRIATMRARGMTLQAIADRLNEEGVPTLRGGERWRPSSVQAAVGYRRPPRRSKNGGGPAPERGDA